MHILSQYLMKTLKFQLKERKNKDLGIVEPIRRIDKRVLSSPFALSAYRRAVPRSCTMLPNDPNTMMLKDRARCQ
ncbi:hypothetical protein H5410_062467 [Solanum commersonii]|uniref:Uncharacterized protein n=1 Tax=Solanum commersonii TaxID=4109 RepID=A0A9J5WAY7_SOLCO|nr:hypothetical protein H5410_062467 [Solanum commersonii]